MKEKQQRLSQNNEDREKINKKVWHFEGQTKKVLRAGIVSYIKY